MGQGVFSFTFTQGGESDTADDEGFGFGHFGHGVSDAFAAKAALFDASVGHVFDAEGGDLVDHDGSGLDFLVGAEGLGEVVGEDTGLEAEVAGVHKRHSLVKSVVVLEDGDGGECLGVEDRASGRHAFEKHGSEEGRAFGADGREQRGAGGCGMLDPVEDAVPRVGIDHGAHGASRLDLGSARRGYAGSFLRICVWLIQTASMDHSLECPIAYDRPLV